MTDPTRPVRDQSDQGAVAVGLLNDLRAAHAERDALRATVDRVRALALETHPWSRVSVWALLRALDGATQAAPRPERTPPCTCRQRIEDPRCLHHHPPAAQGVPLIREDPDFVMPSPFADEDPQR